MSVYHPNQSAFFLRGRKIVPTLAWETAAMVLLVFLFALSLSSCGETEVKSGGDCTDGERSCDGTQARLCAVGRWSVAQDCALTGLVCATGVCVLPGDADNLPHGDDDGVDTADGSPDDPETPGDDPETPGDDPETPGDDPETPGDDPETPGDDPGDDPADQPGDDPADQPGDDPADQPGDQDTPPGTNFPIPAGVQCPNFVAGNNSFSVGGEVRTFVLNLPSAVVNKRGWAVLFAWHGFGDTAANMSNVLAFFVNNPHLPFIGVTPEDTNMPLPSGVDWDVLVVPDANNSKEIKLFDAIMGCLDAQFGVDPEHVHSLGFSAGGIATDLLAWARGDVVASVISYSGAYFSDPQNPLGVFTQWPAQPNGQRRWPQMFTFGGVADTWGAGFINVDFGAFARTNSKMLQDRGHDTIVCDHGQGHTIPQALLGQPIIDFFKAHPRSVTESPFATSGLPASFPAYCQFIAATARQ